MTKAFTLFYLAAFLATRASAFAPASQQRCSSLLDCAKLSSRAQSRSTSPLFMADDEVSFSFLLLDDNPVVVVHVQPK